MCTESSDLTEALKHDGTLEPCAVKVASTVLRGAGDHKGPVPGLRCGGGPCGPALIACSAAPIRHPALRPPVCAGSPGWGGARQSVCAMVLSSTFSLVIWRALRRPAAPHHISSVGLRCDRHVTVVRPFD